MQELKGNIRVYCRIRPLLGSAEQRGAAVMSPHKSRDIGDTDTVEVTTPYVTRLQRLCCE